MLCYEFKRKNWVETCIRILHIGLWYGESSQSFDMHLNLFGLLQVLLTLIFHCSFDPWWELIAQKETTLKREGNRNYISYVGLIVCPMLGWILSLILLGRPSWRSMIKSVARIGSMPEMIGWCLNQTPRICESCSKLGLGGGWQSGYGLVLAYWSGLHWLTKGSTCLGWRKRMSGLIDP